MPQIWFTRPDADPEPLTVRDQSAAPVPVPAQPSGWLETDQRVAGRERAIAIRAALNGAIVAAVLSLLPVGFIIGMPLGGFLAVLFYRRRSWRAEPTPAGGFRLGVLAGALASAIFGIVVGAVVSVSNHAAEFRQQILDRFRIAESRYTDPQQRQVVEYLMTPQGMTVVIIVSAIFMAVVFIVLSGIGGAVSASLLRRKGPRA